MIRKVKFSGEQIPIDEIAQYHSDLEEALRAFYCEDNKRFTGYTIQELEEELNERLEELDKTSSLSLLSSIEASIRTDYLRRCYDRLKDPVSRRMRDLYRKKGTNASLKEDILEIWKQMIMPRTIISDIKAAFNYRDWLAHGRYWEPKLGRKYNFFDLYTLANEISVKLGIG